MLCSQILQEAVTGEVQAAREAIQKRLADFVRHSPFHAEVAGELQAANAILLSPEAKLVRPLTSLLIAEEVGLASEQAERQAVMVELLHVASLLHDDVVDSGTARRGVPTVNAQCGNARAVLTGDYLMCQAVSVALEMAPAAEVVALLTDTIQRLVAGVILEARLGREGFDWAGYRRMAELKTGSLFGLACSLPFAGTQRSQAARQVGQTFGLLFQMDDDWADRGDPSDRCNVYQILHPAEVTKLRRDLFREVVQGSAKLGVSRALKLVLNYLHPAGYFREAERWSANLEGAAASLPW